MAITEYVVVFNQQATSGLPGGLKTATENFKTPTPSGENEIKGPLETCSYAVCTAESLSAAITATKALFPGSVTTKVFAGKKSTGEEK